jgi:hypothetical protein
MKPASTGKTKTAPVRNATARTRETDTDPVERIRPEILAESRRVRRGEVECVDGPTFFRQLREEEARKRL